MTLAIFVSSGTIKVNSLKLTITNPYTEVRMF